MGVNMPEFRKGHFHPGWVNMPVEGSAWPEYTQFSQIVIKHNLQSSDFMNFGGDVL